MSVANTDTERFTPGVSVTEPREHGTNADAADLEGASQAEAQAYLADCSLPERLEVLFGIEPFDYQRSLCDHVESTDVTKVAIQPGRQVGKTLIGAALAADSAARNRGEDTMIAAPYQETADEMMREATSLLDEADRRLDAVGLDLGVETKNKREWEFTHGSRLLSRTLGSDGSASRGKNPKFVIVDEAAFVVDSIFEDVIEPFFSTHDEYTFLLTSTPSGDAGYFYRKVQIDDEWHSPRWPTGICPLVDTEWLAEKERTVDSRTFKTEYLGEFIGSSDRFFDPSVIDARMQQDATATRSGMVLGADIARAGDDRTVIVGIGPDSVAEVLVADRELTLTDAAGRIAHIADRHDIRSVAVDETGLGAGVVEMLESDIERLVSGVKFSLETKQSLYNRCKSMLENDELTLSYDGQLLRELRQLEYSLTARGKTKIEHPDGGHDDHTDALALAAREFRGDGGSGYASTSDNVVVL
ncbi:phage terminase large subunit [environmental Halophage eHP-36]|nr:phage terminase large subunit [environmental Halophage eHP-36]